mmetsp:Transcript_94612/g.149632  ORF Transcript_94612/g.149632 Transcript_94612/m.149632 type:complete len:228 (+) Transcript_94612:99-782(+)
MPTSYAELAMSTSSADNNSRLGAGSASGTTSAEGSSMLWRHWGHELVRALVKHLVWKRCPHLVIVNALPANSSKQIAHVLSPTKLARSSLAMNESRGHLMFSLISGRHRFTDLTSFTSRHPLSFTCHLCLESSNLMRTPRSPFNFEPSSDWRPTRQTGSPLVKSTLHAAPMCVCSLLASSITALLEDPTSSISSCLVFITKPSKQESVCIAESIQTCRGSMPTEASQ